MKPLLNTLNHLFSPRSIAIVGASNQLGKTGAVPLTLLLEQGYEGRIYPINPNEKEVQGLPAFATLSAVPTDIDVVIMAIPAKYVLPVVLELAPGKVKSIVLFSSGFSEVGEQGIRDQQQLELLAKEKGIRLLGPNCLGFMNFRHQVYATFTPAAIQGQPAQGNIGIISQSGAFGAYAYSMALERGLGLSFWASTGNESDVTVAECIQWLVDDPQTDVIMAYMEGCKNGGQLKQALAAAALAGKPIVMTKVGRTESGAKAAASHTAALAGNDAVYETLFQQYGVIRAKSMDEFFTLGHALSIWKNRSFSASLGVLTISGGVGALMADEADDAGLVLPALSAHAQQQLLEKIPFASANNPVDITGQAITEPEVLIETARHMIKDGEFGALTVFLAAAGSSKALWPYILELAALVQKEGQGMPLAICALLPLAKRRELEQYGCVVFADPSTAIRTIAATRQTSLPLELVAEQEVSALQEPISLLEGAQNEVDSLALLKAAGVTVIPHQLVSSAAAAQFVAQQYSEAVAMKIVSRDILHKSDVGGVKLNVLGDAEIAKAYDSILYSVRKNTENSVIDGVLVAPMAPQGVECIVGSYTDPVFGPVVMFGLGGIFVEYMKDVSFRLAPFGKDEALAMIKQTKAYNVLQGVRGQSAADIDELVASLVALSEFVWAARDQINSIDVNPLLVLPKGQGVVAVDALVVANAPGESPS